MNCRKCGNEIKPGEKFCTNCGEVVDNQTNSDIINIPSDVIEISDDDANDNLVQNIVEEKLPYKTNLNKEKEEDDKDIKNVISLVIGIIAIILSCIFNIYVIPLSIIGLVLGIISKKKGLLRIFGIITNILSIIIAVILVFIITAKEFNSTESQEFEGDGFTLQYNSEWSIKELNTSKKVLQYYGSEITLMQTAKGKLDTLVSCDFALDSCKDTLYNSMHNVISNDITQKDSTLSSDEVNYNILKDDIYYMSMNVIDATSKIIDEYYIIVSKNKNMVLTFLLSNVNNNPDILNEKVVNMLSTIKISEKKSLSTDNNSSTDLTKRVGDSTYGYVSIPEDWVTFKDINGGNALQYSYGEAYILTMNVYDKGNSSAKDYAASASNTLQKNNVSKLTTATVKIDDYTAYEVYGYFEDNKKWLFTWYFEAEDNKIHYLAVEGPDHSSPYFKIPNTFKLGE